MDEILQALQKGEAYDYVANNYYKLSKEELRFVLLECLYVGHDYSDDYEARVAESIKEWR